MPKHVRVPLPAFNGLLQYLRTKPWFEVAELMNVAPTFPVCDDDPPPPPPSDPPAAPKTGESSS